MDESDQDVFTSLSAVSQKRIDDAFTSQAGSDLADSMGGFVVEQPRIPLLKCPVALALLDLPNDNDEVLAVFRNAASDWHSSHSGTQSQALSDDASVSLDDFRSVCAVLLGSGEDDQDRDGNDGSSGLSQAEDDSDDFRMSEGDSDDEVQSSSDDDYLESGALRQRRKRGSFKEEPEDEARSLNADQKAICLQAFALFFPECVPSQLPQQRIMLRDIQRVSALLKTRIKADDMMEMLSVFSTQADHSITFADFEQVMLRASLLG